MARGRGIVLNPQRGLEILSRLYHEACSGEVSLPEDVEALRPLVSSIIHSDNKSFKYALLTQTLAKLMNPKVNALALQAKANLSGAFNARSFCSKTIVKFEQEYLNNVLGGSKDPYVSNPLRRPVVSLDDETMKSIKSSDREGWKLLFQVLDFVQERPELAEDVLRLILVEICRLREDVENRQREVEQFIFGYHRRRRFTLNDLAGMVEDYLSLKSRSLGARSQMVVYLALRTYSEYSSLFNRVVSQKSTVSDASKKRAGDVECYRNSELVLVVSVKDSINVKQLEDEVSKTLEVFTSEKIHADKFPRFLIVVKEPPDGFVKARFKKLRRGFRGVDMDMVPLMTFFRVLFSLLPEEAFIRFVQAMVQEMPFFGLAGDIGEFMEILHRHLGPLS